MVFNRGIDIDTAADCRSESYQTRNLASMLSCSEQLDHYEKQLAQRESELLHVSARTL